MRTFELMFGYMWWAICHAVYKDNSCVQVNSYCILFECSLMHVHGGTTGTCLLTQKVPTSIFRSRSLVCTRRAKRDTLQLQKYGNND